MTEFIELNAEIERLRGVLCAECLEEALAEVGRWRDLNVLQAKVIVQAEETLVGLQKELKQLRTMASTTLVACAQCGKGWPPRYLVAGLCKECAERILGEIGDMGENDFYLPGTIVGT